MPYGMRYAITSMHQISAELEESAQVSGASWWQTFRRVLLPLLSPGLIAGWIYILTVSFRELCSSILLYSPGNEVLSILIFEQFENGSVHGPRGPRRRHGADARGARDRRLQGRGEGRPPAGLTPPTRPKEGNVLTIDNLVKTFEADKKTRSQAKSAKANGEAVEQARVFAVDDVSFEVEQGEMFTLLGPSGCGKTTTLRSIAGLEKPDSGRISVGDRVLFDAGDGSVDRERAGQRARPRHGVPVLRHLAAHVGLRQRRLPAAGAQALRSGRARPRSPSASTGCSR